MRPLSFIFWRRRVEYAPMTGAQGCDGANEPQAPLMTVNADNLGAAALCAAATTPRVGGTAHG